MYCRGDETYSGMIICHGKASGKIALDGQAQVHITGLLQPYDPLRKLWSADKQLLSE